MRHASLFSGIGGAEIAASWLGWENIFHVEINPFGQKVLEYWYPKSISYGDITKTDFTPWRGKIDILTGGFPCQAFSVAGLRKGAEDDRYLWPEMLRAIREIQPRWVVGENVTGLLSMVQPGEEVEVGSTGDIFEENYIYQTEQRFTIDEICEGLECAGYEVQPFVIPACAVGAPHRRDRVWIIARLATDTNGNGGQKKTERQRGEGEKTNVQSESVFNTETTPNHNDTGDEEVESGRQDGVLSAGTITHSNSDRQRTGTNKQEFISECKGTADNSTYVQERFATHTESPRLQERLKTGGQPGATEIATGMDIGVERYGSGRIIANTDCNELQRKCFPRKAKEKRRKDENGRFEEYSGNDWATLPADRWRDFPTQSPVCSRDDELSSRLVGITFPKWRAEAIKALGNAWCVAVAYEIFRAINEIENGNK